MSLDMQLCMFRTKHDEIVQLYTPRGFNLRRHLRRRLGAAAAAAGKFCRSCSSLRVLQVKTVA